MGDSSLKLWRYALNQAQHVYSCNPVHRHVQGVPGSKSEHEEKCQFFILNLYLHTQEIIYRTDSGNPRHLPRTP